MNNINWSHVLTMLRDQITYSTMMETINVSPSVCAFMKQLMSLVEKSCG